jgi:hypothetical protein
MLPITFFILLFGYLYGVNCGDTTESIPAMPQVYTDITFNEFLQKVSLNTTLHKRDPFGGEIENDDLTNEILNNLHQLCADKQEGYRASSGTCHANNRKILCRMPGVSGQLQVSKTCGVGWACLEIYAHNFDSAVVKFPQCVPKVNIDQRNDIETNIEYEGHFISSPGTRDFFAEAAASLNLRWDYAPGSFLSSAFGHSWACTFCKAGKLTMRHANSATYAGVFYTGMSFQ